MERVKQAPSRLGNDENLCLADQIWGEKNYSEYLFQVQRTSAEEIIWLLDELCLVRAALVTQCDASELEFYKEKVISYACETHWKYKFLTVARVTMEKK
ncbi:hypothetical protein CI102_10679 [Trichoderma harzianum]|uniref:Uncharacterized protein n=1 Tax=Trichoderma harzianum CBS 226.95 TaxID=983964 RepID=A0A2T3ZY52_TRIHA|nr:hypothetical protein M431DRAFT_265926 [Trichoderma harzianum CBS 226.95]PKK44454.1 hypothetical protein CI102_10679 [Trichoderma harzianum]PTB49737.1 hypothetical protein M431DRAFT_265926 [Trichoderma harzianum CBS 226.95]